MTSPVGYVLLGYGPHATGADGGWHMRADLYAECPECGGMLSLDPDETVTCSCGGLFKDSDAGRFGSAYSDDRIGIYQRR